MSYPEKLQDAVMEWYLAVNERQLAEDALDNAMANEHEACSALDCTKESSPLFIRKREQWHEAKQDLSDARGRAKVSVDRSHDKLFELSGVEKAE